jgi:glycosyltransferase involved in cell wall biosynthesis
MATDTPETTSWTPFCKSATPEFLMDRHCVFITRMFSGLFETIETGHWHPTGIPTVVRLVERLAATGRVTWIVVCKTPAESAVVHNRFTTLTFGNVEMRVVPFLPLFSSSKADGFLNDLLLLFRINRFLPRDGKKNLFYCDRSNLLIAAFLKLTRHAPVVIRILGLYPDQKALALNLSTKLFSPLAALAYRVRFDLAMCSQDGSGIEYYLAKLLNRKTESVLLMNGVEMADAAPPPPDKDTVSILFVGKLIEEKGILECIEAARILAEKGASFKLTVAGKGHLGAVIETMIKDHTLEKHVVLAGSVGRDRMRGYYADTDVYVSLNKLGNLSNTVLEAMAAGKCIAMLASDPVAHTDEYTEKTVPKDAAIRVSRQDTARDLAAKLEELLNHREKITTYSKNMRYFAKEFLWSWEDRMEHELSLLKNITKRYDV